MGLQYGIKEVVNFTMTDFATGKPILHVDYAEVSSNENSAERTDMRAGQGNYKITSWDHTKDSKFNVTVPVVDLKMLALLAGDELATGAQNVFKREVLTVAANKVTLSETPIAGTIFVNKLEGVRDLGTSYQLGTPGTNATDFSQSSKDLTFHTSVSSGTQLVVFYQYATPITTQKVTISANKFPKTVALHMDGIWRDLETETDKAVKVKVFKAKPQGNFTLTMASTDYTKLDIVYDLYAVKDNVTGDQKYIDYIVL